jgi:hypothetical protein
VPVVILTEVDEVPGLASIDRALERPTRRVTAVANVRHLYILASGRQPFSRLGSDPIRDDMDLTRSKNF